MNSPCYGCKERKSLCHSVCVRYAAYHADRERVWAARKKWRVDTDELVDVKTRRRYGVAK